MPTQEGSQDRIFAAPHAINSIAEGENAEALLRASEEFNRSLMEATSDCIKMLDLDGRLLHMNMPGLCAMEIDDFAAICGKKWEAIWPMAAKDDIERSVKAATVGKLASFQSYCPTAKGTPKWWEVTVSPVRDIQGGQVVRLLVVSRDISERKKSEASRDQLLKQLETERGRLAEVFRQAPAFICVVREPDHVFEMANDRYCQLVGRRNVLGRRVREALPEFEAQGFIKVLDKVYQTGAPYIGSGIPVLLAPQPGHPLEQRHIDVIYQALRDDTGAITGIVTVGVDVTERKQAEDALRASEERYRTLFDSMDEGYCVIEVLFDAIGPTIGPAIRQAIDYRFLEVNPAFEKHTGLTGATGQTMRTLIPAIEARWFEIYGRVAQTGEPVRFVDETKAMGRWFDVYAFRLGESGSHKVAILFNDISERKRTEAALNDSEARLRTAIKTVSEVVWTNNASGLMQGEQRGWEDFTGQSREQYQNFGWSKAVHPEDVQATMDAWNRAVSEQRIFEFEHRIRRRDGQWRLCSIRAVPILNSEGSIREWVGVHSDITEQKRNEERLRQLAAELSDASNRKDEFLAMLAHELRNPLAPIRNGLQLMKLAQGQREPLEQARTMMERQLSQLVRLIDDLMDVSRINLGKLELRKERLPLAMVLSSAVETSRPLIEQMGQELTFTPPDPSVTVDADMTRLAQVFLNLLNNAAKYSEWGGHIQVQVKLDEREVWVAVTDTGIGIAANHLPNIFDMFTQVDGSLEKSQGGLGIGLTLVQRLVAMHDGSIEAKSDGPGKGSAFIVRLPRVLETSSSQLVGVENPPGALNSSLRILIVDDNRDGADSLSEMLNLIGNDTRTAYDGQQGVEVAEEYRPEVILLDIGMPKLNGYEACRLIRAKPWGKNVVLIAVTGWGQDKDRYRTQEAGFDIHLVKPVDPQALMTILANLHHRHL